MDKVNEVAKLINKNEDVEEQLNNLLVNCFECNKFARCLVCESVILKSENFVHHECSYLCEKCVKNHLKNH